MTWRRGTLRVWSPKQPDILPDAASLLDGWVGRAIATYTGVPNTIIDVDETEVIVGTGRAPGARPFHCRWVQPALDLLACDGEVEISVEAIRHRSAFCGAVLLSLPGVVKLPGTKARVGWRPQRQLAAPSPVDRGAIRPWWAGRSDEFLWMEITDRPDIGADLHCFAARHCRSSEPRVLHDPLRR